MLSFTIHLFVLQPYAYRVRLQVLERNVGFFSLYFKMSYKSQRIITWEGHPDFTAAPSCSFYFREFEKSFIFFQPLENVYWDCLRFCVLEKKLFFQAEGKGHFSKSGNDNGLLLDKL